jgi:hypothetical protein
VGGDSRWTPSTLDQTRSLTSLLLVIGAGDPDGGEEDIG